eukprot:12526171-Alexandrium_andersonii.AAC.1
MTPWIRPSPASLGSGTIIGSSSRPIMSLRCWACDARWPSAWGRSLCRSRPLHMGRSPTALLRTP